MSYRCSRLGGESAKSKCLSCSAKCQIIQLSSKIKPDAEMFFLEPAELLKRQHGQIIKLLEFQKSHRVRLVSFHRKVMSRYNELEKRLTSSLGRVKELEEENQKLRQELRGRPAGGGGPGDGTPGVTPLHSHPGTVMIPRQPHNLQQQQHVAHPQQHLQPQQHMQHDACYSNTHHIQPPLLHHAQPTQHLHHNQLPAQAHPRLPHPHPQHQGHLPAAWQQQQQQQHQQQQHQHLQQQHQQHQQQQQLQQQQQYFQQPARAPQTPRAASMRPPSVPPAGTPFDCSQQQPLWLQSPRQSPTISPGRLTLLKTSRGQVLASRPTPPNVGFRGSEPRHRSPYGTRTPSPSRRSLSSPMDQLQLSSSSTSSSTPVLGSLRSAGGGNVGGIGGVFTPRTVRSLLVSPNGAFVNKTMSSPVSHDQAQHYKQQCRLNPVPNDDQAMPSLMSNFSGHGTQ